MADQQLSSGPAAPDGARQALPPQHVVRRTRIGGFWLASGSFAVVLLLLLIFILENGRGVDVAYLGAHGHLPLGVALLLAAVLGAGMVAVPGAARVIQLRSTARKHRLADEAWPATGAPQPVANGDRQQPDADH
jgi:uncharacterized integral membrane protein